MSTPSAGTSGMVNSRTSPLPLPSATNDKLFHPIRVRVLSKGIRTADPDHLVATIKRWESVGVTGINFLLNAMEMIPQDRVMDSMRLFASEVMPQFQTDKERNSPVYTPTVIPSFSAGEV